MTSSSMSWPSPADPQAAPPVAVDRWGVVACGAIARHLDEIAVRRDWPLDIYPLPPLLHNHPDRIAGAVERALDGLRGRYRRLAVGYADCGSYGAVDEVCDRLGVPRLRGQHCYDLFAGRERLAAELAAEPGTYLLTDFLALSFRRSVIVELGLDRFPELREDYFGHYRRVVWLAQRRTPELELAARDAADSINLPLQILEVGDLGLERELAALIEPAG